MNTKWPKPDPRALNVTEESEESSNFDDMANVSNFNKQLLNVEKKVSLFYDKTVNNLNKDTIENANEGKSNNDEIVDTFKFFSFLQNIKNSDIDVKNAKLIQKQSLIDLIIRNREHGILVFVIYFL